MSFESITLSNLLQRRLLTLCKPSSNSLSFPLLLSLSPMLKLLSFIPKSYRSECKVEHKSAAIIKIPVTLKTIKLLNYCVIYCNLQPSTSSLFLTICFFSFLHETGHVIQSHSIPANANVYNIYVVLQRNSIKIYCTYIINDDPNSPFFPFSFNVIKNIGA